MNYTILFLTIVVFISLIIVIQAIIYKEKLAKVKLSKKIIDTSVIIDGRICDIVKTGFLEGILIVPKFVLQEIQLIADSSDNMKRSKGRRGLEILNDLRKVSGITVEILDKDYKGTNKVDEKLVIIAKEIGAKIITNDYNLNKIAEIQGIDVLNINDLSNAIKPTLLPGEKINIKIVKEGKEKDQGIAYLNDGTMIVVDGARKMINKKIEITITNVLQTDAGKMIFAKYEEKNFSQHGQHQHSKHKDHNRQHFSRY